MSITSFVFGVELILTRREFRTEIMELDKKERVKSYQREYMRKYLPAWRKANKDKVKEYTAKNNEGKVYDPKWNLKRRFSILMRFSFTCQYCGRKPPEVILEIDHILPRAKGGRTTKENLTVSCRECNQGKTDTLLFT